MENEKSFAETLDDMEREEETKDVDENDENYSPNPKKQRKQNRPKVINTWLDKDVEKLITEVETRPCIWNVGDKEYKLRNKRDAAWLEIVGVFRTTKTVEELTAKWQSLRTQYRTSVATSKRTKSGQGATSKVHWKYHSQMAFIGAAEQSQSVRSESNFSMGSHNETDDDASTTVSGNSGIANRNKKITGASVDSENENVLMDGLKCAMERLQQPRKTADDAQTFGNYLVTELRKIRSDEYRKSVQRQLLQQAWDLIDKQPVIIIYTMNFTLFSLFQFFYRLKKRLM